MKRLATPYLTTLASAVLLAWSFPTFHLHWLAWVALVPLFVRTVKFSPWEAALHFYLCAHLFHTLTLQWLWANIFWAGGWAIIGQQFLCMALSLCWALVGFVWTLVYARSSRFGGALCIAGLWTGMEVFQSRAFSGFGWCALGYTQGANLWVAQWAALGGVCLISFLIVLINALLALGLLHPETRWQRLVCIPVVMALVHGVGYVLLKEPDYESNPLRVGVIQPNFSQEMKWDPAYDYEMLQRTAQMTRTLSLKRPIDLAVWPEALIVRHFENPAFKEALSQSAIDSKSYVFTGVAREDYATSKSYNSSVLITPEGNSVGVYDKVRLAAFGEYVPFEKYLPILGKIAFGGVSPGDHQITLPIKDRVIGPLICFEVLFTHMAEKLRQAGADMLIVVTNLAWFGGSSAIAQELEIARMRAIETRLPLIHSANTGISGVFDPYGRFSVVRHTVSSEGELLDWGAKVRPKHVVMRRFLGDFPLAAPGERPLPGGPVVLPWLAALFGIGMAIAAAFQPVYVRFTGDEEPPEAEPRPRSVSKPKPESGSEPKPGPVPESGSAPKPVTEPKSKGRKERSKKTDSSERPPRKRKSKKQADTASSEQPDLFFSSPGKKEQK